MGLGLVPRLSPLRNVSKLNLEVLRLSSTVMATTLIELRIEATSVRAPKLPLMERWSQHY